jgi:hypothetical protein
MRLRAAVPLGCIDPMRYSFRLIWGWECQGRRGGRGRGAAGERGWGSGVSGRRGVRGSATLGQPHIRARRGGGRQDLGSSQRPLSAIERRRPPGAGGWLTGESADVRVCAMPGPPRRLDAPDRDVRVRWRWRSPSRRRSVPARARS